jgi:D-alanyl-D-alanine carboxypeptidase (penicillin-binding protein 5/6)
MPGSRMFIDPKMKVPVEDLIKGMIVQSGNDVTRALSASERYPGVSRLQ